MIPLSCRENIRYVDPDGINWVFKPKTGALERKMMDLSHLPDNALEQLNVIDEIFGMAFIGMSDPKKKIRDVTGVKEGVETFSATDKLAIINMWAGAANAPTVEEKKS